MGRIVLKIFDILFKALSLIGFASIVLSTLASHISPETAPNIQIFGLLSPIIIALNIIIGLYWLIRLTTFVYLAILSLILCIAPTSRLYQLDIKNDVKKTETGIKLVSYNVMHFTDKSYEQKSDETLNEIQKIKPDVICFQEFSTTGTNSITKINDKLSRLKYRKVFYKKKFNNNSGLGISVYSRYPIIKSESIPLNENENSAMYVDVKIKHDTIRIYNLHLQSTNVSSNERILLSDKDFITKFSHSTDYDNIKLIVKKLSINTVVRAQQAEIISKHIKTSPHKVIVCGDFNDVPNSYTYNTIRGNLDDSFSKAGKGYGYSFKDFFEILRIDFILCDDNISVIDYQIGNSEVSDHYPIIVELNI